MPKKTVEKLEIKELKTYQCSDGSVFDIEDAALAHEQFLKDCKDNPLIAQKFIELQSKIAELEVSIHFLEEKVTRLEAEKAFRPAQPQSWPPYPYQNPIRFDEESKKLPSEPGNIIWNTKFYSSNKKATKK